MTVKMMEEPFHDGGSGRGGGGWHGNEGGNDRNFPCQALKISKVSLVVMGS
jgi:hypothetical protein